MHTHIFMYVSCVHAYICIDRKKLVNYSSFS